MAARFDEAVELAEQAFVSELSGLVEHLTKRLTGQVGEKTSDMERVALCERSSVIRGRGWWNSRKAGIIRLEGFDHVQR